MAKIYLVVTAVGQDRRGTVEMITDVVVNHFAIDVDIDVTLPLG
jgi:glycine cleavage system regulatory protein